MKRLAYIPFAFAALFAFCVAAHAQDALPGAPDPPVAWSSGAVMGIVEGRPRVLSGTGKVVFYAAGVQITGDATADGA